MDRRQFLSRSGAAVLGAGLVTRAGAASLPEAPSFTDPATQPFTIANGDWSVSPDGREILFQEARDGNLWLLTPGG